MEERYGQDVDLGLLWNIHNTGMQAVKKVGGGHQLWFTMWRASFFAASHGVRAGLAYSLPPSTHALRHCACASHTQVHSFRCTTRWRL